MRIVKTTETLSLMRKNLPSHKNYLRVEISKKIQQFHAQTLSKLLKEMNLSIYMKHLVYVIFNSNVDVRYGFKIHYKRIIHLALIKIKAHKH